MLVGASVRRAVTLTSLGGVAGVTASSLCSSSWAGGCNETQDIEVGRESCEPLGCHSGQGDPTAGLGTGDLLGPFQLNPFHSMFQQYEMSPRISLEKGVV